MLLLLFVSFNSYSQNEYIFEKNINYRTGNDYIDKRCVLDFYYPKNIDNYSTIIYFHGGALKGGNKNIPENLKNNDVAVIAVNYRLYPDVATKLILDDTAKAVKWVYDNKKIQY